MADLRSDSQRARDYRRDERRRKATYKARSEAIIHHIVSEKLGSSTEFAQYRRWPKGSRKAVRGWMLGTLVEEMGREVSVTMFVLTADGLIRGLEARTETLGATGWKPEVSLDPKRDKWIDEHLAVLSPDFARSLLD